MRELAALSRCIEGEAQERAEFQAALNDKKLHPPLGGTPEFPSETQKHLDRIAQEKWREFSGKKK